MAQQTYWEDQEAGSEVPALEKNPTTQQLVKYAGASGDFYQIHYDKDFALGNNLPGVILHGALKNGFLGQMMTNFAGHEGWLRKLAVRAWDKDAMMVGHELVDGRDLESAIDRLFANPQTEYLHIHFASPGCYAARVERA